MSGQPLEASVRILAGCAVIDLKGEINAASERVLTEAYAQATGPGNGPVLLNFSGVHFINSTGIALIVALLAQSRKTGRRLMVCGLSDHYLEIFRITRLADFMTIYPDEVSALQVGA
jgi:anti-sigma B factor antagonist